MQRLHLALTVHIRLTTNMAQHAFAIVLYSIGNLEQSGHSRSHERVLARSVSFRRGEANMGSAIKMCTVNGGAGIQSRPKSRRYKGLPLNPPSLEGYSLTSNSTPKLLSSSEHSTSSYQLVISLTLGSNRKERHLPQAN